MANRELQAIERLVHRRLDADANVDQLAVSLLALGAALLIGKYGGLYTLSAFDQVFEHIAPSLSGDMV